MFFRTATGLAGGGGVKAPCLARLVCVVLACLAAARVHAAGPTAYTFVKIADGAAVRPDGKGNFQLLGLWAPSLDGDRVVFADIAYALADPIDSIWSAPALGGGFTRLVSIGDPAPGGTGAFTQLDAPIGPTARNGTVVFQSLDQTGVGVYTLPTAGGMPTLIINYKHDFPDGAPFSSSYGLAEITLSGLATDGAHVAFNTDNDRLLVASIDGSHLTEAVESAVWNRSPDPYPLSPHIPLGVGLEEGPPHGSCDYLFAQVPAPTGVALAGANLVFSSEGAEGAPYGETLYATPLAGFRDTPPYIQCYGAHLNPPIVASAITALPGDPVASPYDVIDGYVTDADEIALAQTDTNGGYQCVTLYRIAAKGAVTVACNATPLPGLTTPPLRFRGLSLKDQTLVIAAEDAASNVGLYGYQGGVLSKIIATGDMLAGSPVLAQGSQPDLVIAPTAASGGALAFNAVTGNGLGVYTARPAACAADITADLAISLGPITKSGPGEYRQAVTLRDATAAAIPGTLALALNNLAGARLVGGAVTACATPAGRPYVIVDLGPAQVLGARKSVTVDLTFAGSASFTYQASVLQGFSR